MAEINKNNMLSTIHQTLSICYVHYLDKTIIFLEEMRTKEDVLDNFTYHKSLQKIVESHCVSTEKKAEIKLMKRPK